MVKCNKCEKVLNKDNSGYLSVGIMLCIDCSESFVNIDDDEKMTYSRETITRNNQTNEVISDIFLKEIWKNAQNKLLDVWGIELREELRQADDIDKEYIEALLFRLDGIKKRIDVENNSFI